MIYFTIVVISFLVLLYVNWLSKRDPRVSISAYKSYLNSFAELVENGAIVDEINISDIVISEHRIIVQHEQISGGMWGALANSRSKYKDGYSNEYKQCKFHYDYKSNIGVNMAGETPYLSISKIKLTFVMENIDSMRIAYIINKENGMSESKLDLLFLLNHL